MKLHYANYIENINRTGGGFSFLNNLTKTIPQYDYAEADIYFIAGASMIDRQSVVQAKEDGKKIVLRVDNVLRNSRNKNSGMSRMLDFAQYADLVVYQSQWAKDFLRPYLKKDGPVILNGTNLELYKPGNTFRWDYDYTYLYSRFNRDEGKNWQTAWYYFYYKHLENPASKLFITGQFSPDLVESNFDFFNNEQYKYLGVLDPVAMAEIYRASKYFIYTYSFDACSNSLIEALCSGCKIVGDNYFKKSGGAPEILSKFRSEGREYFSLERMAKEYGQLLQATIE